MPTTTTPHARFRTVAGVRLRYADRGSSHKPTVVLTGPWPESVSAFKPIWASLSGDARLLAVGLPGFGASRGREDLLPSRAMGEFLAQLIAGADLGAPHFVAPDVGTAAAAWGGEADG
jgi:pimeloyl-ACP methyl ester carboxylesterase